MGASKRVRAFREKTDRSQPRQLEEALGLVKEHANAKFTESVDVAVNLGVDPRKSDQVVRGATALPHGSGKSVRVAVFAQGENAEKAKAAGADVVGFEDLAEQMKGGDLNYDTVIATPDAMRVVGQLGRVLGPRGLMPNPKVGTVTFEVGRAVNEAKSGKVEYRVEKAGIVHAPVGKVSFDVEKLKGNLMTLMDALIKAKPSTAKGTYLKKVTISATMGPGVNIDIPELQALVK